jgi:deazaflavin-dependent oxidoreductase (nitroreductase family)
LLKKHPNLMRPPQRIKSRFADRLPGFGIVTHVGRKSRKVYRTPVNVFRAPEGFLIALTCGRESEWVKNVLMAGGCELETRGVRCPLCTNKFATYAVALDVSGEVTIKSNRG